jgi:hypothetical protein
MLLVMVTLQLIACAASLSELLHCRMAVTRLSEVVVNVPFGVEQGPSVHSRVTVVVERAFVPVIVLTTVTVHLIAVVAPWAAGAWPLHWSITMLAGLAAAGRAVDAATIEKALMSVIRATAMTCRTGRADVPGAGLAEVGVPGAGMVSVLTWPAFGRGVLSPTG